MIFKVSSTIKVDDTDRSLAVVLDIVFDAGVDNEEEESKASAFIAVKIIPSSNIGKFDNFSLSLIVRNHVLDAISRIARTVPL